MLRSGFNFAIPASSVDIELTCTRVRSWLIEQHLHDELFPAVLLLRECLNNAVLHGCREDPALRVMGRVQRVGPWLSIFIGDDGPGFDWRRANVRLADDNDCSGRGMELYSVLADRVSFNQRGNRVLLRRRIGKGVPDVKR